MRNKIIAAIALATTVAAGALLDIRSRQTMNSRSLASSAQDIVDTSKKENGCYD